MELVASLHQCLQDQHSNDPLILQQALQQAQCNMERISPYIPSPDPNLGYGRKLIYRNEQYEAIVVQLPPFASTPIHDHGNSICCVYVVSGTLINREYIFDQQLDLKQESIFHPGEFMICHQGQIHSMHNPAKEKMISVHLYTPPLPTEQTTYSKTGIHLYN